MWKILAKLCQKNINMLDKFWLKVGPKIKILGPPCQEPAETAAAIVFPSGFCTFWHVERPGGIKNRYSVTFFLKELFAQPKPFLGQTTSGTFSLISAGLVV